MYLLKLSLGKPWLIDTLKVPVLAPPFTWCCYTLIHKQTNLEDLTHLWGV